MTTALPVLATDESDQQPATHERDATRSSLQVVDRIQRRLRGRLSEVGEQPLTAVLERALELGVGVAPVTASSAAVETRRGAVRGFFVIPARRDVPRNNVPGVTSREIARSVDDDRVAGCERDVGLLAVDDGFEVDRARGLVRQRECDAMTKERFRFWT